MIRTSRVTSLQGSDAGQYCGILQCARSWPRLFYPCAAFTCPESWFFGQVLAGFMERVALLLPLATGVNDFVTATVEYLPSCKDS
jgi:hypothetical protein